MRAATAAFRNSAIPSLVSFDFTSSRSIRSRLSSFPLPLRSQPFHTSLVRSPSLLSQLYSSQMATASGTGGSVGDGGSVSMEKQFEEFRRQLEESGVIRDRIKAVAMEVESAARLLQSTILLVHQSLPVSRKFREPFVLLSKGLDRVLYHALVIAEVFEKASVQISVLKDLFKKLEEIIGESPGQYYRYHGEWRSETQNVISLIAFLHWLETGSLLTHSEAQEKLGLNVSEFGLDVEDYLIGLCFMSNEMPRYVVNRVTAGDYNCPRKVLTFLTDLHSAFRMLNLRNDFLRKKFDSLKYDLRRVEEVFYDVKIRGLAPANPNPEPSS